MLDLLKLPLMFPRPLISINMMESCKEYFPVKLSTGNPRSKSNDRFAMFDLKTKIIIKKVTFLKDY